MARKHALMTAPMSQSRPNPGHWPRPLVLAAGVCLVAASAWAAPIPVSNPSLLAIIRKRRFLDQRQAHLLALPLRTLFAASAASRSR